MGYGNGRRRQRRRLWLAQGKLCPWCELPITAAEMASPELTDRDHVVPKSHGGEGRLWNLQLLHRACNMEKADWCPGCDTCQPAQRTEGATVNLRAYRTSTPSAGTRYSRADDGAWFLDPEDGRPLIPLDDPEAGIFSPAGMDAGVARGELVPEDPAQ